MKRPVWIDSDAGIDDAMALLLATRLKDIELVGASAVAGSQKFSVMGKRFHKDVCSLAYLFFAAGQGRITLNKLV